MTIEEFIAKCDWEGGFEEAIWGYGLRHTDLDVQEGEFYEAVKVLVGLEPVIRKNLDVLEAWAEELAE